VFLAELEHRRVPEGELELALFNLGEASDEVCGGGALGAVPAVNSRQESAIFEARELAEIDHGLFYTP
jgi:hypothetical protein